MLTFYCGTVDVMRGEIMKIYGIQLDQAGRCLHYHSEADVVALRCRQCHKYYSCYKCHDESENHDFKPADTSDPVPVLCGNCMNQLTRNQYEQGFCPYSTRDAGFIMIFILNSSMLALNLKNCTFLVNQY